ncbi:MAG: 4Fe-4S binding protein [Christensenellaceae bacterium]|jgi:NAD-dependent dihydropyrimidine dehydrogenase PreA subunit|nr:4Fe-4S binding protein [Christensenellaceae bacterium]
MAYIIDSGKCVACGACAAACPVEAVECDDAKFTIKEDVCIDCGTCAGECPSEAISV